MKTLAEIQEEVIEDEFKLRDRVAASIEGDS